MGRPWARRPMPARHAARGVAATAVAAGLLAWTRCSGAALALTVARRASIGPALARGGPLPGWLGHRGGERPWHPAARRAASGVSRGASGSSLEDMIKKMSQGKGKEPPLSGAFAASGGAVPPRGAPAPSSDALGGGAKSAPAAAGASRASAPGVDEDLAEVLQQEMGPPGQAPSPEAAVRALMMAAGPDAGLPPPEVIGLALAAQGVEATEDNMLRALRQAAAGQPGAVLPGPAEVALALAAARGGLAAPDPGTGAASAPGPIVDVEPTGPAAVLTPEAVVQALVQAAGPDAGTPPPEVLGLALQAAGVPVDTESATREAAGAGAAAPTQDEVEAVMAAVWTQDAVPQGGGEAAAEAEATPWLSPEQVVRTLLEVAGPEAGVPPPEVIGQALQASGTPVTEENLLRALQQASGRPPSDDELAAALAGATERAALSPAPKRQSAPRGAPPGVPPTPESIVAALIEAAGPEAGAPPPDVVGAALRVAGAATTVESVLRGLTAAAGPGAPAPTRDEIAAALAAATTPGSAGFP